jgi:outer membrane protein OmpA-like peptidoglycan-associated protein
VKPAALLLLLSCSAIARADTAPPPSGPPAEFSSAQVCEQLRNGPVQFHRILFVVGKAELKAEAEPTLAAIAACIHTYRPSQPTFLIAGHTDARGADEWNRRISLERASAIRAWLLAHGVGPADGELRTEGVGEDRPVADNRTEEGRAKNRRIELSVLKPTSGG